MKLSTHNINTQSNIQEAGDFGMDQKDMPHITHILRNQMYSDKLLAILREYSTNAFDAHADNNIEAIPIEVTFPTITEQTLKIRDFGSGLTEEEVMTIYIKYGASTKRNSNAFTGCLGIGCKSGFAYSSQFTITSFKDNVKQSYLAKINEQNTGTISKIVDIKTDESNGVEISIPIKSSDHSDLKNKGGNLFKHWIVKPKTNILIPDIEYTVQKEQYAISTEVVNRHGKRGASVFMGNILYPINLDVLNTNESKITAALSLPNLILYAPLGSIDIAASRESLEYTDKTKNQLFAIGLHVVTDLAKQINEEVDKFDSPIKASVHAQSHLSKLGYELRNVIAQGIRFKKERMLTNISFNATTAKYSRDHKWRANEYRNKKEKDIMSAHITADMYFCTWDPKSYSETNATRRIRTLQSKNNWNNDEVYFLIKQDELNKCKPALTQADITNLNDVVPLPANRTIIAKDGTETTVKSVKISVCTVKQNHMKSACISENVESTPEANGKYYYIPLDRYDWIGMPTEAEP